MKNLPLVYTFWVSPVGGVGFRPAKLANPKGDALRTAIVAIHQLPPTSETLWLRILGRGKIQEQAITELQALPLNHPDQQVILELVYSLRENLRINQELDEDDREFA